MVMQTVPDEKVGADHEEQCGSVCTFERAEEHKPTTTTWSDSTELEWL